MKVVNYQYITLIILISLHFLSLEARFSDETFNTVDINDVNKNTIVESIVDGIPTKIIIPISGLINQIICESQLIWLPDSIDERALYVAVYLKDGEPNIVHVVVFNGQLVENLFFKQRGRGWIQSINRFAEKMNDLELDIPFKSGFPLNINYRRPNYLYKIMNLTAYGECVTLFLPNPGYRATIVRESDDDIWKGEGSYRAIAIIGFTGQINIGCGRYVECRCESFNHQFKSLYIISRNNSGNIEHKFLTRNGTKWIAGGLFKILENTNRIISHKCNTTPFEQEDENIKSQDQNGNNEPKTIDNIKLYNLTTSPNIRYRREAMRRRRQGLILNLNGEQNIEIKKYVNRSSSMDYTMLTPRQGKFIIEVKDGSTTIWKANEDEICIQAHIFVNGNMYMLELDIENGGGIDNVYFSKRNGIWED